MTNYWKIFKGEKFFIFFWSNCNLGVTYPKASIKDVRQKKPSALKREHPALQNMKFLNFFLFLWVIFCSPGTEFRIRIRIHWPDWIRIWIRNTAFDYCDTSLNGQGQESFFTEMDISGLGMRTSTGSWTVKKSIWWVVVITIFLSSLDETCQRSWFLVASWTSIQKYCNLLFAQFFV
jgi:hypothetical protein